MKISTIVSLLVAAFGLYVAIRWRQPLGFLLTAAGAIAFAYFFISNDGKKK